MTFSAHLLWLTITSKINLSPTKGAVSACASVGQLGERGHFNRWSPGAFWTGATAGSEPVLSSPSHSNQLARDFSHCLFAPWVFVSQGPSPTVPPQASYSWKGPTAHPCPFFQLPLFLSLSRSPRLSLLALFPGHLCLLLALVSAECRVIKGTKSPARETSSTKVICLVNFA